MRVRVRVQIRSRIRMQPDSDSEALPVAPPDIPARVLVQAQPHALLVPNVPRILAPGRRKRSRFMVCFCGLPLSFCVASAHSSCAWRELTGLTSIPRPTCLTSLLVRAVPVFSRTENFGDHVIVVFDTETTGFGQWDQRIISVAAVVMDNKGIQIGARSFLQMPWSAAVPHQALALPLQPIAVSLMG